MTAEKSEPPHDLIQRVIEFYIGCLAADARGDVNLKVGSADHLELGNELSPVIGNRHLPRSDKVDHWCQRASDSGESIFAGWPVIIGTDRGAGDLVARPLVMAAIRLVGSEGNWSIKLDSGDVELNPYALDLLGIEHQARDAFSFLVRTSPAVQEGSSPRDRVSAILSVLRGNGIEDLDHLDPLALAPLQNSRGIHNAGLIFGSTGQVSRINSNLLRDLEAILEDPELLASGPAAVMLGLAPAPAVSLPKPYPTVLPSTLVQDQAVASAMENVFSVVTGPPGTGKSQVLCNVVTAAVANNETVLFASRNNKAVDVVFERLELTSTEPCIVRAGRASQRNELASNIKRLLSIPCRGIDPRIARREWYEIKNRVRRIYASLSHDVRVDRNLDPLSADLRTGSARQELESQLHQLGNERIEAGRTLLNTRWIEIRRNDSEARQAASELADTLELVALKDAWAYEALELVPSALPVIPVWGVTNLSARTNLPLESGLFDLVVIDEAHQCDIASVLPLLARAHRALIIGDPQQLHQIPILSQMSEIDIGLSCGMTEDQIKEFSCQRSCFDLASDRVDDSPLLLDMHFRSHSAIIGFSNRNFYDDRLILCSDNKPPTNLRAIEWFNVDGDSQSQDTSRINSREASALAEALAVDLPIYCECDHDVGVVTPYRAQAILIRDFLRDLVDELDLELSVSTPYDSRKDLVQSVDAGSKREVTVATAHGFQGDERDVIYFSPVVGPSTTEPQAAWAADPNLVNVALTRARRRLVIVGNKEACRSSETMLADLVEYVNRTIG